MSGKSLGSDRENIYKKVKDPLSLSLSFVIDIVIAIAIVIVIGDMDIS